jgi:cupin superfamily acireductone dioxygenase involved in methionine salvage
MNAVRDNGALRQELEVIEASTHALCRDTASAAPSRPRLDGVTLLYVGGRTHHVAQLRAIVEGSGATFVLHDGGIEHHLNLLAGRASQADLVVFPVDYHAAQVAKQLGRPAGKRFIPLRSASATSLLAALQRPEVTGLADAAD